MPSALTPAERIERQRTDQLMLGALDASDCPVTVTGHRTAQDTRANQSPVRLGDAIPPAHYRVVYDFDTLRGPGQRYRPTIVHVSPLANGGYPVTPPSSWIIGDVVPFSPHFARNVPICHGNHVWIPNRTWLVDYVIHQGKLLNFDEPPPVRGYHGYNGAAIAYWRDTLNCEPLDPTLRFPVIHPEDVRRQGGFGGVVRTAPAENRFRPRPDDQGRPHARRFSGLTSSSGARFRPSAERS